MGVRVKMTEWSQLEAAPWCQDLCLRPCRHCRRVLSILSAVYAILIWVNESGSNNHGNVDNHVLSCGPHAAIAGRTRHRRCCGFDQVQKTIEKAES
jgi:hypothetical protein